MFGLLSRDEKNILDALSKFDEIEEAIVFGSRAIGNYKAGSDVDLALKGPLGSDLILQISESLNEDYPLPYFFDVIDYNRITNEALENHIDAYGKSIYSKK